jgi:uncharacterized cupin superfamily protein
VDDNSQSKVDVASSAESMKLMVSFASEASYAPGRRAFFKYRDLGVEGASAGRMRAYQNTSIAGMLESTGWHFHVCEMQFVYVLRGEMIIEFEDGTAAHFGQGDAFFIPGGVRHNETYVSEDKDSIEVSVPGKIHTVACERPAGLPDVLRPVGNSALIGKNVATNSRRLSHARQ